MVTVTGVTRRDIYSRPRSAGDCPERGLQAALLVAAVIVVVAVVLTALVAPGSGPTTGQGESVTDATVAPDYA
jgi:hypothetical protein